MAEKNPNDVVPGFEDRVNGAVGARVRKVAKPKPAKPKKVAKKK